MPVEVVAIFGPTASGKSSVAAALASLLGTEVVSADALQVYRGLPILTDQPSQPTHLVAVRALDEGMSVGEYAGLAHTEIDRIADSGRVAVVTGGTGLYLRAALVELGVPPAPTAGRRAAWEARYDADPQQAHATLESLDPAAATAVHVNDRRRVVRALELAEAGASLVPADGKLWAGAPRRPTRAFGLDVPPAELERRIVERVDSMFARGVEEEVRTALRHGLSPTAEQALGLREIASLPAEEARARLVARTRRYAAYQRKWMRRTPDLTLLDGTRSPDDLARAIAADIVE